MNLCSTNIFAFEIGIVGRQACSLFGGKLPFFWGEVAVLVLGRVTFQFVFFNKIHEHHQAATSKNVHGFNLQNKHPINNLLLASMKKIWTVSFQNFFSFNINFQLRKSMRFIKNPGSSPASLWPKHLPRLRDSSMIGVNIMLGLGKTRGLGPAIFLDAMIWFDLPNPNFKWYEILQFNNPSIFLIEQNNYYYPSAITFDFLGVKLFNKKT